MARSKRRRDLEHHRFSRRTVELTRRNYVASVPVNYLRYVREIDYPVSRSIHRERGIARGVRQVQRTETPRASFHYDPGAQFLFERDRKALVVRDKQPTPKKLCKCKHDRSEEQRRTSRKLFGRYGARGIIQQVHLCHC